MSNTEELRTKVLDVANATKDLSQVLDAERYEAVKENSSTFVYRAIDLAFDHCTGPPSVSDLSVVAKWLKDFDDVETGVIGQRINRQLQAHQSAITSLEECALKSYRTTVCSRLTQFGKQIEEQTRDGTTFKRMADRRNLRTTVSDRSILESIKQDIGIATHGIKILKRGSKSAQNGNLRYGGTGVGSGQICARGEEAFRMILSTAERTTEALNRSARAALQGIKSSVLDVVSLVNKLESVGEETGRIASVG